MCEVRSEVRVHTCMQCLPLRDSIITSSTLHRAALPVGFFPPPWF